MEHQEFLVQVEAEEQKVLKEDQGPLALREKKEKVEDEAKMELRDCLVSRERKEMRVHKDHKVTLVLEDPLEILALLAKMVLMVQLVHQALVDLMDPLEFRDQQEQPAVLDHRASKVHQELGVNEDTLALEVPKVNQDRQVLQVKMVLLVPKDKGVLLGHQDTEETRVQEVLLVQEETVVLKVQLDLRVRVEHQVTLGSLEQRETRAHVD